MHSTTSLYDELSRTLMQVNNQIAVITESAEIAGVEPTKMMNADGTHSLTPLLLAKSNCLNGMAMLKTNRRPTIVNHPPRG